MFVNHLRARQIDPSVDRPDAGKWRFTSAHLHGHPYPIGYCSPIEICPAGCTLGKVWRPGVDEIDCERCGGRGVISAAHPCQGHDTPEEACEHYRQYLLFERTRFGEMTDEQRRCQVCRAWTQGIAEVGGLFSIVVCDDHRNLDSVAAFVTVTELWES